MNRKFDLDERIRDSDGNSLDIGKSVSANIKTKFSHSVRGPF
jgi:hypothetical protein